MNPRATSILPAFCVCFAFAAAPSSAQELLVELPNPTPTVKRFGHSIDRIGDVDQDGIEDFAVGAPGLYAPDNDSGCVHVFAGGSGALLWSIQPPALHGHFGWAVSGAGDVDADGWGDLVVGAPRTGSNFDGSVYVYSGRTHALLHSDTGTPFAYFGYAVDGLGDVDLDGHDDWIAGTQIGNQTTYTGFARVYSGATGNVLYTYAGSATSDYLGRAVSRAGDVDLDGHADFLIGSFGRFVRLHSGATGALLREILPPSPGFVHFGVALAGGFDVDLDGSPDFVVGDPEYGVYSGRATLYSGSTGAILGGFQSSDFTQNEPIGFGQSLAMGEDSDGDGVADWAGGTASFNFSVAVTVSGSGPTRIHEVAGKQFTDFFGAGVALYDFDSDGATDTLYGATQVTNGAGYVRILGGGVDLPEPYCTAKTTGSNCHPTLYYTGVPSLSAANPFRLRVSFANPGVPGMLFYGYAPAALPFGGGYLCVGLPLKRTVVQVAGGQPTTCGGTFAFDFTAHAGSGVDPNLVAGVDVYAQYWFRDSISPSGPVDTTNGLRFTLRP
ncbi:MAG: FG-GAP repeat protein [Planctomycetes bacterium]|nr:FG-GAP repeat protein [Planctomycetota bacterium]